MILFYIFTLLPLACHSQGGQSNRQRQRTVHVQQPANDYGFSGFQSGPQQSGALTPWWNSDELLPNVFPWLPNQKSAAAEGGSVPSVAVSNNKENVSENKDPSADLVNFLNGPDGKDGPMKHIMRVLRILPPKEPINFSPNGQPLPFVPQVPSVATQGTRPPSIDQICPFGTEPLFTRGQYLICNPRNISGCPLGYVCDKSFLLSEHICCKDRNAPPSLWTSGEKGSSANSFTISTTANPWQSSTSSSTKDYFASSSTSAPIKVWSIWAEWTSSSQTPSTVSTTSSPSTTVQPESTTFNWSLTTSSTAQPETTFNLAKSWPPLPSNPFVNFPKYPTPNQLPSAYNKRIWQPIDSSQQNQNQVDGQQLVPGATPPPWDPFPFGSPKPLIVLPNDKNNSSAEVSTTNNNNRKEHTSTFPTITIPVNGVEVIPLTVGNVMSLPNGDFEWASTITLIRDGDKTILVDTGVPADTNILIRELSKHNMRPDNVDTVVITHGHPDHFGNQNLFSRKRQLFSSFEFIGNKFSRTALVEQQFRKLTPHVEVWKTPGHTPEDLTVIVRDVPTLGSVAVVGDLILNEDFLLNPEQWTNTGSWDRHIQQNNINMIVCMVDCIVPGHGGMFRLHDEHRKNSNCAQRYPIYYANYYG